MCTACTVLWICEKLQLSIAFFLFTCNEITSLHDSQANKSKTVLNLPGLSHFLFYSLFFLLTRHQLPLW